jgi:Domain of unknown function (DUF4174)
MHSLLILFVLLSLLQACTHLQPESPMNDSPKSSILSSQSEALQVASTSDRSEAEFNLSQHQGQHRVVLIFAPSERSPAYQQQLQAWQVDIGGIRDRDLKLVEVIGSAGRADGQPLTPAVAEQLRQRFEVSAEEFVIILIGKDGTEKQRSQTPIDLATLFGTIDVMPMRQREMRSQP